MPNTLNNIKRLRIALEVFRQASSRLNRAWYNVTGTAFVPGITNYPFDSDFNELISDIVIWIDTFKTELDQIEEDIKNVKD